jgi:SpoVK/Ycf46/Vps4 family AAA+-type ATPase
MILLHGPPGTGKTSLSKALAQKIYVRNAHIFQSGLLFEVNCHSLFSKWFSESGKLVMKLFQHISDIADDESCLVTLLIDEVESIAAARNNASRSGEPGDAIRVVNAVLTSLDQLRRRKNVLVMCTSNMQSTLDEAFLDRLDLNIHIGSPSLTARKEILGSCVRELIRRGLIFNELEQALHSTVASMVSTSSDLHAAASERKRWLLDQIAEHTEVVENYLHFS